MYGLCTSHIFVAIHLYQIVLDLYQYRIVDLTHLFFNCKVRNNRNANAANIYQRDNNRRAYE